MSVSGTIVNSTATYSCNTGYTLTGDDMRTCMETGLWSGSEPICTGKMYACVKFTFTCVGKMYVRSQCLLIHEPGSPCTMCINTFIFHFASEIDCGPLGDPANGAVSLSSIMINSVATYSCNTGYTLTGDDMRTCLETGVWSGSEPMCTGRLI